MVESLLFIIIDTSQPSPRTTIIYKVIICLIKLSEYIINRKGGINLSSRLSIYLAN